MVFVIGLFMDLLDTTIVNVALPTFATTFGKPGSVASNQNIEWVVTAYLLSLAVWIPASGWLGDRFGTKRIFMLALFLFTTGSILCGEAQSLNQLIFFRVIQGIGGGMLTPVGTAMLFRAFPPHERAKASAVLVVPIAIAPAIGPVLGGLLVDGPGWRWIFRVNIPIGILGLVLAWRFLQEHTEDNPGRFDIVGFILSGAGLPILLFGLSKGPSEGWSSLPVLGPIAIGVIMLAVLIWYELHIEEPLLALRLFGNRLFRSTNVANFMMLGGLIGVLFVLPLFLQQLRGLSATQSGLATFPQAIGMVVTARFASRIYPKIGPRRMAMAGMFMTAALTFGFVFIGMETDLWWIRGLMFGRGVAMGIAMIPMQAAMFAQISRRDSGQASALSQTNRQVAGSIAVAILATVLTIRTTAHMPDLAQRTEATVTAARLSGFHDAYFVGAVLALLGAVAAAFINDQDAAPSMSAANAQPQGH